MTDAYISLVSTLIVTAGVLVTAFFAYLPQKKAQIESEFRLAGLKAAENFFDAAGRLKGAHIRTLHGEGTQEELFQAVSNAELAMNKLRLYIANEEVHSAANAFFRLSLGMGDDVPEKFRNKKPDELLTIIAKDIHSFLGTKI